MSALVAAAEAKFNELKAKILELKLPTYQGRLGDGNMTRDHSINGCTMIACMVICLHICGLGITAEVVGLVIDQHCRGVLEAVRSSPAAYDLIDLNDALPALVGLGLAQSTWFKGTCYFSIFDQGDFVAHLGRIEERGVKFGLAIYIMGHYSTLIFSPETQTYTHIDSQSPSTAENKLGIIRMCQDKEAATASLCSFALEKQSPERQKEMEFSFVKNPRADESGGSHVMVVHTLHRDSTETTGFQPAWESHRGRSNGATADLMRDQIEVICDAKVAMDMVLIHGLEEQEKAATVRDTSPAVNDEHERARTTKSSKDTEPVVPGSPQPEIQGTESPKQGSCSKIGRSTGEVTHESTAAIAAALQDKLTDIDRDTATLILESTGTLTKLHKAESNARKADAKCALVAAELAAFRITVERERKATDARGKVLKQSSSADPRLLDLGEHERRLVPPAVRDRAFFRTALGISMFDKLNYLKSENARTLKNLNDPMHRPPQSQLEIAQKNGQLTDANPIDRNALLRVAVEIEKSGVLSFPTAVDLYISTRGQLSKLVQSTIYPSLRQVSFEGAHYRSLVRSRITRNLPVAVVWQKTYHISTVLGVSGGQSSWHRVLMTDTPHIGDAEFLAAFKAFTDIAEEKERRSAHDSARGRALSAQDLQNLKACVGGRIGALLEFIIVKGFDSETQAALGISAGRARLSVARYDAICTQLPALRVFAESTVAGKVIGTTGSRPLHEPAAVNRLMMVLTQRLNLLGDKVQADIASFKRSVRHDPNVLLALQAIVSNMGASFKSEDGLTPADRAVLPAAATDAWGTTGSQVGRIHKVLVAYLDMTGRMCTLAETKRLLVLANISCRQYTTTIDQIALAQHFAAKQLKFVRMIVVAFSLYAFTEGLDYKSLLSVNSDKNQKGRGEFMVKNQSRETVSHSAGGDNLGKLALFSMLLKQVHETDLAALFEGDSGPEAIPGWQKDLHFGASPGLAVATAHVHGGVRGMKESAASNMAHFWQKLHMSASALQSQSNAAQYYQDPTGNWKPICVHEMDNAHGAADLEHCFMLGLDFFLYDRDAVVGVSLAGGCSRFMAHEAVNGALANRCNGAPIIVPCTSPETARPDELADALDVCLDKLVAVANGATMKMGGGHVTVVRSNLAASGAFEVRPAEIKRFMQATEAQRATFGCAPMPSFETNGTTVIELYRLVWRCMQNSDPATRVFLRSPHLAQWVKRGGHCFLKPRRAPAPFHALLESLGGFLGVVIPSDMPEKQPDNTKDTGGSYAGLGESIRRADEIKALNGIQKHYPPALLDDLFKNPAVKIEDTWKLTGTLPDLHWSNLRAILRLSQKMLTAEIERRLAISRRKDANVTLESAQVATGVQSAVYTFLLSNGGDKRVPAMRAALFGLGMSKRDAPKHRAQCISEIFKRARLKVAGHGAACDPADACDEAEDERREATPGDKADEAVAESTVPGSLDELSRAEIAAAKMVECEAEKEVALRHISRQGEEHEDREEEDQEEEEEQEEQDEGIGIYQEPPVLVDLGPATVENAEHLLDAAAEHAENPRSMWGCCGGVEAGRHYYCDCCGLYFHQTCQKNMSKGRQAPLCPACHEMSASSSAGRSTRRRI